MIRVESCVKPIEANLPEVYAALYQLLPTIKNRVDTAELVLPHPKHALVLKMYTYRLKPEEKLTAIVIENPKTQLSRHFASFSLTKQGLTNVSLPPEHVLIDNLPAKPNQVINSLDEYNQELAPWMVAWFKQMAESGQLITPPCLFISRTNTRLLLY